MIIAVASGKGGTGKTTVAVAMATAYISGENLFDTDAEEPNCHLFLPSSINRRESATVLMPEIDDQRCSGCGKCSSLCKYNALANLGKRVLVFPELCHSCGGCALICPTGAVREIPKEIGFIEFSHIDRLKLVSGKLAVGRAMSPPLIRAVRKYIPMHGLSIIDCPPGTSCPMVTAVRGSDFVLLVTEPTPFGLHDLILAVNTVRKLGIPCGVILNRSDCGDKRVHDYCSSEKLPILLEIEERLDIAKSYSCGIPLLEAVPELRQSFKELILGIGKITGKKVF